MAKSAGIQNNVQPEFMDAKYSSQSTICRIFFGASGIEALIVLIVIIVVATWGRLPKPMFVGYTALLLWGQVVLWFAFWSLLRYTQLVEHSLHRKSFIDGLTGVFNYRYLDERMQEEQERIRRRGGHLSLLLVDLDHFKLVNDRFGHRIGNVVLGDLAQRLADEMRGSDILGRLGGDEFLVLLPDTGQEEALSLARRLTQAVRDYRLELEDSRQVDFVGLSVGVASFPENGETVNCVVAAADKATYRSKQKGGGCATISDDFIPSEPMGNVWEEKDTAATD